MEGDLGKVRQRMVGPKDKLMGLHEKLAELKLAKNDLQEVWIITVITVTITIKNHKNLKNGE